MIVDKNKSNKILNEPVVYKKPELPMPDDIINGNVTIEKVQLNPLKEIYAAVRRTIESLREKPNDPNSPPIFKTVKLDHGQFNKIVKQNENTEFAIGFPAVFIRFINVRYLVAQQRVSEGRATMRIRFILNDLNNSDDDVETHGFEIFELINQAIQDAKNIEPALNERCNLLYFDMPEHSRNGLQAFWIDYEVWFRQMSGYQYRNWIDRYLVMPPFTNHSDAPQHDTEHHGNHQTPTFEQVEKYEPSVENPDIPDIKPDDTEDKPLKP